VEGTSLCRHCGTKVPVAFPQGAAKPPAAAAPADPADADIAELARRGQQIEAIKRYRERHGVGLAEAKYAVETLDAARKPGAASDRHSVDNEVVVLLRAGRKIEAVKVYRQRHRVGLKEARKAVEALGAQHGVAARGFGCAGVILLIVAGVSAAAWRFLA
jgi:ribosomal protein L7/L12